MADTSQRKARRTPYNSVSLIEKNKEGASISQGNEVAQNTYNVIRSEEISFANAENFNQSESTYFTNANQTYNEAEKLLQALEKKKATLSYTASFNSNEYTLNARTATVSELIANGIEQDLQDKTVYLSPKDIENNFVAQFVAPATNTGSATFRIQKYDGTYHTTLTAKKYSGTNLVNLVADDIKESQLYTLVIISGELVVFGIQPNFLQTQQRIALSYNSPTSLNYSAGGVIFDDFSGSGFVSAGTLNLTGLTANASWYIFAIANPTTGQAQIQHYNSLTPTLPAGFTKKKLLFAFITNASSQLRGMKIHNLPNAYKVQYLTNIQEYPNYVVQIAGELKTFTVPSGVEVEVEGSYRKNNHGANNIAIGFTHPSKMSLANDGSFFSYTGSSAGSYDFGVSFKSFTDTNRQIRISATALTGLDIIYTWGYTIYL